MSKINIENFMERIKRGLRGYNISISPSNDGVILEEDDGIVIEAKRKNGTYTASYTYPYSELEFQADVCVAFIKHVRSGEDKFLNNKQLIDTTKTSRYRFLNLNTGKYGASFVMCGECLKIHKTPTRYKMEKIEFTPESTCQNCEKSNGRIEPIQKIFTGIHIDLDKVFAISDAEGQPYFEIHFQLRDKPIEYWEGDGTYGDISKRVAETQSKVDDLIDLWKRYKMQERK